jgi:beta-glucanase (GH16 family)
VTKTAKATAKAWADGYAHVKATATRGSTASARAGVLARALAHKRAATRATSLARQRAYDTARPAAYKLALAAAKASSAAKAKAAATAKALAAGPRTPAATCAGPNVPKPTGGYWVCTFDDEFNGTNLDRSKWIAVTTAKSSTGGGGACFVDSPNNISEGGGDLTLTVRAEAAPITCSQPNGSFATPYTAGQVATLSKFSQTYGRFAVRASFPSAAVAGLQSALWLWPNNPTYYGGPWPGSGEIDIAEMYSMVPDRVIPYVHYNYSPLTTNTLTNVNVVTNNYCLLSDPHAFHQYAVEWTTTTMTISYDGQTCLVDKFNASAPLLGSAPFDQPFFVALTQSLGVKANAIDPNTPLPSSTLVDWVRVWK